MRCWSCGSEDAGCYSYCECAKCEDPEGYQQWREQNPDEYQEWLDRND